MFFLDKPYVSEFLKDTLKENNIPVVETSIVKEFNLDVHTNLISEEEAVRLAKNNSDLKLYSTSENAIDWITKHLSFTNIPQKIELFKNKAKFRELISPLYPNFFFQAIDVKNIDAIKYETLPKEFIIKPSVGFFSMGVYRVTCKDEWERTKKDIKQEIKEAKEIYPETVVNTDEFIIEECIYGDEFALDVYFDKNGEPVVLNILEHIFFDDNDVSDRVYSTSKKIIQDNLEEFTNFAKNIGKLSNIKNFPIHAELRRNKDGILLPIEINPMRFGGWCTTADMAKMAYGINSYMYYYESKKPNWDEILKDMGDKIYSIIVLDNSSGIKEENIKAFDYEKLLSKFEAPLEIRHINFNEYPVFAFLFTKTCRGNETELEYILGSKLTEFIHLKQP